MRFEDVKKCFEPIPNYLLIPVTKCYKMEEYNELLKEIESLDGLRKTRFKRTASRGLCVDRKTLMYEMPGYEVSNISTGCEILVLSYEYGHCRIQFRPAGNDAAKMNRVQGRQAFTKFKKDCESMGIDLEYYRVGEEVGWEIKQTIEKPFIDVLSKSFLNIELENVHHLDINSSYPAGLAESHPEFRPLIEKYYNNRKVNRDYKAILNLTIGFMQSKYCDYAYSQLSRDAIHINNAKVAAMTEYLMLTGRVVLLRNTDGIWYQGPSLRDDYNFTELGEWHEDYSNCKFRIKSAGAYEFIDENGIYHPVVRGATNLEKVKPRSEWTWGDIYHETATQIIKYRVREDGYVEEVTEDEAQ